MENKTIKHYEIIDKRIGNTKGKVIKICKNATTAMRYLELNNYNNNLGYNIIYN